MLRGLWRARCRLTGCRGGFSWRNGQSAGAAEVTCSRPFSSGSEILPGVELRRASSLAKKKVPRCSPTVMDLSRALGWLGPEQFTGRAHRAKPAALTLMAHTRLCRGAGDRRTLAGRQRRDTGRHGLGTVSNPVFPRDVPPPREPPPPRRRGLAAGGRTSRPAGRDPSPGRRHASRVSRPRRRVLLSQRRGFSRSWRCVARGVVRIAYVDIDAHHADGVEHGAGGQSRHAPDLGP